MPGNNPRLGPPCVPPGIAAPFFRWLINCVHVVSFDLSFSDLELYILHPLRMIYEPIPGALDFLNDVVPPHLVVGWGIIAVPFIQ